MQSLRKGFVRGAAAVLLAAMTASAALAQAPNSELLVSTQWLADHLNDPNLVVIYVGDPHDYKIAHIPGSRSLTMDKIASSAPPGSELLPDDQLKANLEAVGVSDNSRVVIYTADSLTAAGRLFFTLDYVGFAHAALLDGGWDAWKAEKRPITTAEPGIGHGSLTIHPRREVVASMEEVKRTLAGGQDKTVVLDARPLRRYRTGHIPGALPRYWQANLQDPDAIEIRLKPVEQLRKEYAAAGIAPGSTVVTYCEVGMQASYAYFVARYLGYKAAMYDGSYSEWTAANQPVVSGDSRR